MNVSATEFYSAQRLTHFRMTQKMSPSQMAYLATGGQRTVLSQMRGYDNYFITTHTEGYISFYGV